MDRDKLLTLYELLGEWARESDWDKSSRFWAAIVEARRQAEIDLRDIDPDWHGD